MARNLTDTLASGLDDTPKLSDLKAKKAALEKRRDERRLAEEIEELERELAAQESGDLVIAELEQLPKVSVTVDLADFADRIVLDGRTYFHGQTYLVRPDTATMLSSQCDLTHRHDREVHGRNSSSAYRRSANITLNPAA